MSAPTKTFEIQFTASITVVVENAVDEASAFRSAQLRLSPSWNIEDSEARELIGTEEIRQAKRNSDLNVK